MCYFRHCCHLMPTILLLFPFLPCECSVSKWLFQVPGVFIPSCVSWVGKGALRLSPSCSMARPVPLSVFTEWSVVSSTLVCRTFKRRMSPLLRAFLLCAAISIDSAQLPVQVPETSLYSSDDALFVRSLYIEMIVIIFYFI